MKQLNMVTLNQLPFPANHLAPGELRCENASHVDVATVERAAGFGLMGNLWEPPKSMGTTKFVIYYLCYTYNVVFCFDWVKGCRGDIPLENLDFGIIAPPVGTPWDIYIYILFNYMYTYTHKNNGSNLHTRYHLVDHLVVLSSTRQLWMCQRERWRISSLRQSSKHDWFWTWRKWNEYPRIQAWQWKMSNLAHWFSH